MLKCQAESDVQAVFAYGTLRRELSVPPRVAKTSAFGLRRCDGDAQGVTTARRATLGESSPPQARSGATGFTRQR
jgi:hypothetical protein